MAQVRAPIASLESIIEQLMSGKWAEVAAEVPKMKAESRKLK
jgi:hypothetical protein